VPLNFDRFLQYWLGLAAGETPDSSLFDPVPVLDLLPHLIFVEFEDNPFRVRFRHSGTKYEDIACVDITDRYLDEFGGDLTQPAIDTMTEHYRDCRQFGRPSFGSFRWPDEHGRMMPVEFALFPLAVHGVVRQCIALEDYGTANTAVHSNLLRLPPDASSPALRTSEATPQTPGAPPSVISGQSSRT
jgi:hypothetical protein